MGKALDLRGKGRYPNKMSVDGEQEAEIAPGPKHDPTEIRIYIKALKRAMKYLPIGSRAYYYLGGELTRANRTLKTLPADPSLKRPH